MRKNFMLIVIAASLLLSATAFCIEEINLLHPDEYIEFVRDTGKPVNQNVCFSGDEGTAIITIINGNPEDSSVAKVSSATIMLNGDVIFYPNEFNQNINTLQKEVNIVEGENYIEAILKGKPGGSIRLYALKTHSEHINSSTGGIVTIQNHLGDIITLDIPPLALAESTSIYVTALAIPPPNPIAINIFPGLILGPPGLIFSKPIKTRVEFQDALTNPELATLFWLKDANLVLPIANQTRTQNSIEGEISHFSPIIGGVPSHDEIMQAIFEIIVSGGDTSALGILETIDDYQSIMGYAQQLRVLGQDEKADQAENSARGMLEERSLEILSSPLPSNPCGHYSNALKQLADLIMSELGDEYLAEQINNRSCTLFVLPQYLFLDLEETWELTAELFDPNGNKRSCSSINWYSSNLNSVEITLAINNTCLVKAISEGTANISANCDGLLGYAQVSVGPTGTYAGHFVQTVARWGLCPTGQAWCNFTYDIDMHADVGSGAGVMNLSNYTLLVLCGPPCPPSQSGQFPDVSMDLAISGSNVSGYGILWLQYPWMWWDFYFDGVISPDYLTGVLEIYFAGTILEVSGPVSLARQ